MMKTALFASLVATASAFAPTSRTSNTGVSLQAVIDKYPEGSINFAGKPFKFDPLNLADTYEPLLPFFQEAEIRHGRTAMLAVVGFIATDFIRIPGDMYSFEAIPKTVDAHDALLKSGPMYQLLLWIGLWELIVASPAIAATMKGERAPGDYAWNLFQPKSAEGLAKKKASELLNGRLAMIAIGGIATQSITSGHGFPYI